MKSLLLIRHGRSKNNLRHDTSLNSDISDFGVLQAMAVGRFLNKPWPEHVDFVTKATTIYVSPFYRCLRTAQFICKELTTQPKRILVCPAISECFTHISKSVFAEPLPEEFPEFDWSGYTEKQEFLPENNEQFIQRMYDAYSILGEGAVVITHGFPVHMLALIATNPHVDYMPSWDWSIDNCSLTWILNGRKKWWARSLFTEEVLNLKCEISQ